MKFQIYNSLTRQIEDFNPVNPPNVSLYACGPTIYDHATIGNFRTYTISDVLVRALTFNGYKVNHVMNMTDVGHLTGDNYGDSSLGEDRLEKSAKKEGKNAWEISKYYGQEFVKNMQEMNMENPTTMPKPTEHIQEQIDLVKKIEEKGLTYEIKDGIYFDTQKYEEISDKKYGELSTLNQIKPGARVRVNENKKNPRDFALWKFSYENGRNFDPKKDDADKKRHMEWESPWGLGFPGWHIECSAMSMKYLGETIDIHIGGEDLRQTHHPNEIVQSESVTGKKFVNYWMHVRFLTVNGERMGKSKGNAYTISDIKEKGYSPLALRYLYLTAHYRDPLNFTWGALAGAQNSLEKLVRQVQILRGQTGRTVLSEEKRQKVEHYSKRFNQAINADLNTPKALSILWEVFKSNIPSEDKYDLAVTFDEVLGLKLLGLSSQEIQIPEDIKSLVEKRQTFREEGKFEESDKIRKKIEEKGFRIKDTQGETIVEKTDILE